MRPSHLLPWAALATAKSTLFQGATIIAFNQTTSSLYIVRNGSLLITNDRITTISPTPLSLSTFSNTSTEIIDATDKIISPGFVDTHRHGWVTAYKTLGSNGTLAEVFGRYGQFISGDIFSADDVYVSQLAGLYEALNAGVTTTVDHAHHNWSPETAEAGLQASIDSGARVFLAYTFHNVTNVNWTVEGQLGHFRQVAEEGRYKGTATSLGVAYDSLGVDANLGEVEAIVDLASEFNASVWTTHSVSGVWNTNPAATLPWSLLSPLFQTTPFILSHASHLTPGDALEIRRHNAYIAVTPESDLHFGMGNPTSHHALDRSALGSDTSFTYSTDIITQARIWLQTVRERLFAQVRDRWHVPASNPMSVAQAFLLATRNGGLALKRPDLGVIAPGAKADLVIFDGSSPGMLGWLDPVAAVILHAGVGDVEGVLVDGVWKKRGGKIVDEDGRYEELKGRFLETARRIQEEFLSRPVPVVEGVFPGAGLEYEETVRADVLDGEGDGYGELF